MNETIYKLTDRNHFTRRNVPGETLWTVGREKWAPGGELCTANVIHAYRDPLIAVFMGPIHGKYLPSGRMFRGEGIVCADDGTKIGLALCLPLEWMPIPAMTLDQRIEIGIRSALIFYGEPRFVEWSRRWLSGEDRSASAAAKAWAWAVAEWAATAAAKWSATRSEAAWSSGWAEAAAEEAAKAAEAAAAGREASAWGGAAVAVAWTADAAKERNIPFDLLQIIHEVVG